jgi:hypothetical protein
MKGKERRTGQKKERKKKTKNKKPEKEKKVFSYRDLKFLKCSETRSLSILGVWRHLQTLPQHDFHVILFLLDTGLKAMYKCYTFLFLFFFLGKKYTKGKTSLNCHFIQCRRKFKMCHKRCTPAAKKLKKGRGIVLHIIYIFI